jgi:hypothetical protein
MTGATEHQRPICTTDKVRASVFQDGMELARAFDMEYGKAILSQTLRLCMDRAREIMMQSIEPGQSRKAWYVGGILPFCKPPHGQRR